MKLWSPKMLIKIGYDLNGQPVEEAFFGVYYASQGGNQGQTVGQLHMDANMIKQTNWGFRGLVSFRAPAGTLDKRMPVFCLIARSVSDNPQWNQLSKTIHDQMMAAFNQKLQQGYGDPPRRVERLASFAEREGLGNRLEDAGGTLDRFRRQDDAVSDLDEGAEAHGGGQFAQ